MGNLSGTMNSLRAHLPRVSAVLGVCVRQIVPVALIALAAYVRYRGMSLSDLWEDELWRANQIANSTSYEQLLRGHYKGKEAPVQLSEWILGSIGISIFGSSSDLAYRVWGVLFSSISALTIWLLLKEIVAKAWALVGLAFFALSPGMIEHSQEFKPYSLDVLLTLLCIYFFFVLERSTWRRWLSYVLFLSLFALFSNCFLFFSFVVPVVYWRVRIIHKYPHYFIAPFVVVPLLFYAGLYSLHSLALKKSAIFAFWLPHTFSSWKRATELLTYGLPSTLTWYAFYPVDFRNMPPFYSWLALGMLVIVVPAISLYHKHWAAAFIFLPFLGQVGLSIAGLFPMFQRVSSFYYPLLIVSFCICAESIWNFFALRFMSVNLARVSALIVAVAAVSVQIFWGMPSENCCMRHTTAVRELVRTLEHNVRENDLLFASTKAEMALDRYNFTPPVKISFVRQKVQTVRAAQAYNADKVRNLVQKVIAMNSPANIWLICIESEAEETAKVYQTLFTDVGYNFQIVAKGARAFLGRVNKREQLG